MNYQYYTVVSGDSFWGIATKFGLTVNELLAFNGMTSTNQIIHPGDRLIVGQISNPTPDPTPEPGEGTQYYTVVSGDSLWGIATKFGLTVNELLALNGMSSTNQLIHPGDVLIVGGSGGGSTPAPQPDPDPTPSGNLNRIVQWFRDRIGVVKYSDDLILRQGPNHYDCSSAVYASLMHAGFLPEGHKGNTATLFQLEGSLFQRISRTQVRFGDVFIIGSKSSGGVHAGVFTEYSRVVHSINYQYDMMETDFDGWVGNGEQHFYRIVGGTTGGATPDPTPNPTTETTLRHYNQSGRFTASRRLAIVNQPRENATVAAYLEMGESVYIDSIYETNKFMYVSYVSFSGLRRYIAVREYTNGQFGPLFGTLQ